NASLTSVVDKLTSPISATKPGVTGHMVIAMGSSSALYFTLAEANRESPCRLCGGSVTTLRSGFPNRNRGHRSRLIVADSIAEKTPPHLNRAGTRRRGSWVFETLGEPNPAPVR